jgi:type II secretion system protein D
VGSTAGRSPATQPVIGAMPLPGGPIATRPASEGELAAATFDLLRELTGNQVQVEVTPDGVVLYGAPEDLEILQQFIQAMDERPGVTPTYRIFQLQNAQASTLATEIQRLWNESHRTAISAQPRAEDRVTIIPQPQANVLMVATAEENMDEIESIIEQLDRASLPPNVVLFRPVQLQHIQAAEAEQVLKNMLQELQKRRGAQNELLTIQANVRTNSLMISASEEDFEQIQHLIQLIDVPPTGAAGSAVKLAIFPLKKAVATELADALNGMLQAPTDQAAAIKEQIRRLQIVLRNERGERALQDINLERPIRVFAEQGTNSLIVATIEENLEPMGEIIEALDTVPIGEEMIVKVYPLDYADAEALQNTLRTMFEQGRNLAEVPSNTGQVPGREPANLPGAALAQNVVINSDPRTNSLFIAGRAEQVLLVEQIIKAVDIKEDSARYAPRIVHLQHADVEAVSEVLQKLADQRQKLAGPGGANAELRENILIIPDVRTNSLIIVARQDNYEEIAKLATDLDAAEDQWLGQIRIINLERLTAGDLADKIEELWERRAEIRRRGNLPEDKPVIVPDARSNSLVVASSDEDFQAINQLVQQLEQQKLSPMAAIRTVILKHNDASKLAGILRDIFQQRLEMSTMRGQEPDPSDRVGVVEDAMTNMLLITSSQANYDEVIRLIAELDQPPPVEGMLRTYHVRYADVRKAAEMIQELFDKGVYRGTPLGDTNLPESARQVSVVTDMRSSSLIVSASPENLAIVEALLREIDQADAPVLPIAAKFFTIQNADVVSVASMLEELMEGMRESVEDPEQLQLRVVPNTRNDTLMVVGTRYAVEQASILIPKIDAAGGQPTAEVRVYSLEQASAGQIAQILTELFERQAAQDGQTRRTPISVQAAETSNALIVSASRDAHLLVQDILKRLDQPSQLAQQMRVFPLERAKADQLAETLERLLSEQGRGTAAGPAPTFAITPEPRTNSLVVVAAPDLLSQIEEIIQTLDTTRPIANMALRVFRLQNQRAEQLAERLQEFFEEAGAAGGQAGQTRQMIIKFSKPDPVTGVTQEQTLVHQDITVTPDPDTNSLMVLAPQDSIEMMQMLVEMLDSVALVTAEIQVFPLRNADAEDMRTLLEELFQGGGGGGGRSGEERMRLVFGGADGAAPAAPAPGAPPGEGGTALDLAFSVDQRTNSLIAAGSASYLRIVERLVLQLDYREIEERIVNVVHLSNATATDVAQTLQSYFDAESQVLERATGEGEAAVRRAERQVTVQDAGETSNTLLLSYNPRMESQIINMINELDLPPEQVMIQVLMAEVTLDNRLETGMEFALQDLIFSEKAVVGPNGVVTGENKDVIFGTDLGAQGQSGLGGISFTVTGEDFNFLLRALQSEGRLEVLSRPAILVQDNQDANITVGERVPTVQDITVSSAGVVTPSVTYEEVGIILDVTPIINPDGYVNMQITPEISAIGTSSVTVASGVSLPTFTERSAETTVTVKDGETIIIGGLITSRENDSENKVPIAGDIPILGNLFRAQVKTTTKTELLMVLTPHVIRDAEQARRISLQMRDQTGLIENVRRSPLMNKLQLRPEEDQFGPVEGAPLQLDPQPLPPGAVQQEEYGPTVEEYGPTTSSVRKGYVGAVLAAAGPLKRPTTRPAAEALPVSGIKE